MWKKGTLGPGDSLLAKFAVDAVGVVFLPLPFLVREGCYLLCCCRCCAAETSGFRVGESGYIDCGDKSQKKKKKAIQNSQSAKQTDTLLSRSSSSKVNRAAGPQVQGNVAKRNKNLSDEISVKSVEQQLGRCGVTGKLRKPAGIADG